MKILHINSYNKKGGAESVFNLTRNNLSEFTNYSGFVDTEESGDHSAINFSSWENNLPVIGVFNYIFSFRNYRILNEFLNNREIDIIHLHGFFSSISPSILLAIKKYKRKKSIRIIQTLHDYHLICPNSSLYNNNINSICEKCIGKKYKLHVFIDKCDRRGLIFSIIKGIRSFLSNNILKHKEIVDNFISPSNFLNDKLLADGVPQNKITVIRNPIPIEINNDYTAKENIICYFGRYSKEKNLEFLISSFLKWKESNKNDYKLFLIGEGEEENKLRGIANNHQDIMFFPFMPLNLLYNKIKSAKVFCLTSSCYENSPVSVLEAASLRIISLVPNLGGMKETIESVLKSGKVYESNSMQSWAENLDDIVDNYDEHVKNLEKDLPEISKKMNRNNYLEAISELYIKDFQI